LSEQTLSAIKLGAQQGPDSLRADLRNAGARWSDQEVVVDHELVTSRKPDDLPAFNREMVRLFELAHEAALQHH